MEVYGIAQILPVARVGEGNQPVEAGGCDVKHVEASARLRIRFRSADKTVSFEHWQTITNESLRCCRITVF